MENKIDIGCGCYVSCMSKAELVRPDTGTRIALTPTEYKIICYLVDNAGLSVQLESIAVHLWGSNYSADRKDPESIKSHITRIRSKLSQLHPALKDSLVTNFGYGSYVYVLCQAAPEDDAENSFLAKITAYSQPVADPYKEVMDLREQLDKLVMDLEVIQRKLDIARHSQNRIWEKIYGAQFEAAYLNFSFIQRRLEEMRRSLRQMEERMQQENRGTSGEKKTEGPITWLRYSHPFATRYETDILLRYTVHKLTSDMPGLQRDIQSLDSALNNLCREFFNGKISVKHFDEFQSNLPVDRKTALALVSLTDSWVLSKVYDVIFSRYMAYLTEDERQSL